MITRFQGERGRALLIEELRKHKIAIGIPDLPEAFADAGKLEAVCKDQSLIEQNGSDNDTYLLIAGTYRVIVNGKEVARRFAGDSVGEMATISPIQRRSASIVSEDDGVVLKITEQEFSALAARFPEVWRRLAQEVARRLEQRNILIRPPNEKIRVFVISSVEALPVARAIENAFAYDPFATIVWANGVFRVTNYTLESLENELDRCDFAIAIAHPDDQTKVRDEDWPTPRDNVVFELGFFMGRLGRSRAILMEPRGTRVKLPSDLAGISTIRYRFDPNEAAASMGPACNELRDHIMKLGRNI
ncbi:cyclic nucleotide-binding protein [Bradyrhizobium sp. CCBAU 051011]|uniref:TIR domain-containing protein n=1 Tax=Bradyrhizobium sp. CCBAU 051011 TaxID=858422 RepID=UPI001373C4E1|nr:TIR domain-containing protein [Bradyrhizobium sp. CCBAU 051011]QHO77617.1 cyclic nucleotide-binding protein [Bradyrhizobium sp. CCBAU 051011]